jgi:hypothetical protein
MKGSSEEETQQPRWDSYPLPGVYATSTPRWDAGVRRWPERVLLGIFFVSWIGLTIAYGYENGALLGAAVVSAYPLVLIILPIRKRLAPREVTRAPSPAPLRLWALGWLLLACAVAWYSLFVRVELTASLPTLLVFMAVFYSLTLGAGRCNSTATALEEWRIRPRKKNWLMRRIGKGGPPAERATLG